MSLGMLGQLNTKAGCLRIDVILVEYMHELVAEVQILFQMLSWRGLFGYGGVDLTGDHLCMA